jgi:hypothetical protein
MADLLKASRSLVWMAALGAVCAIVSPAADAADDGGDAGKDPQKPDGSADKGRGAGKDESPTSTDELYTANNNTTQTNLQVTGKLTFLEKPDPKYPGVVATFESADHTYLLRLANENARTRIAKLDKTECTLVGWFSAKRVYFTCMDIVANDATAPQPKRGKRGGL